MKRLIATAVIVYAIVALSIKDSLSAEMFKASATVLFIGFVVLLTSIRLAKKAFSKGDAGKKLLLITILVYVAVASVSGFFLFDETFLKSANYLLAGFIAFLVVSWLKGGDPPETKKKGVNKKSK